MTATAANNPILAPLTPRLTSSAQQTPNSPDPRLVKIIAELGLRYRPLALADQEAHAAQVALLTRDLRGVDPDALTRAVDRWVQTERFMPRASDLLELVRKSSKGVREERLHELAAQGNILAASLGRDDVQWVVRHGELKIELR